MVRISAIDAQMWICQLKKREMIQFEYKDLPAPLKDMRLLRRAKEEGLIIKILKRNGRNIWRITDKVKCNTISK